jgi:iduronate 2-sulfatase
MIRLFFTILSLMTLCACSSVEDQKPNVLFIAVDDLRPELGVYGKDYIQSPNIDRLGESGVVFQNAFCNIPVCGASRASLMTGLRPTRNRFLHYYARIDKEQPGVPTLPKYFRDHGYYTIANGKIMHDEGDAPESWDEEWRPTSDISWRDYLLAESKELEIEFGRGPAYEIADVADDAYFDGRIAEKGMKDLERLKEKGEPFFLALGFLKPHLPFNAPKKYWDIYQRAEIQLPENDSIPPSAPKEANMNWGELRSYNRIPDKGRLTDSVATTLIHGYRACVSYTDAQIGLVLKKLEELGLRENTIIILWGDHGWNLREHGLWCKHCNFNTSLQTPLIVSAPDRLTNHQTAEVTEFVDIYPTLCDLAGLSKPAHLEGNSFVSLLENPQGKSDGVAVSKWFDGVTLINENHRYTEWIDDNDSVYARMLYDHGVDSEENYNVAEDPENQSLTEKYSKLLRHHRGENFWDEANFTYDRK